MVPSALKPALTLKRPMPVVRRVSPVFLWSLISAGLILGLILAWRYMVPHTVENMIIKLAPYDMAVTGPATLDAINKAEVSSRVSGRLTQILIDNNSVVKQGQTIAIIEQADLEGQVVVADANQNAALSAVRQAEANLASGQASLVNTQINYERQKKLFLEGWVAQATLDKAEAALLEGQAQVRALEQAVAFATAQVHAAQAGVTVEKAKLGLATVTAPFDGIVTIRYKNSGDVLTAGASIAQIVDPASLILKARFDESVIGDIRPNLKAHISFGHISPKAESNTAINAAYIDAHVLRLGHQVDPETREFTVDLVPSTLPENWALDQRAMVRIVLNTKASVISVPATYILTRKGQTGVWVCKKGRAQWRELELSDFSAPTIEVMRGLSSGDVILTSKGIYENMRVRQCDGRSS